MDKGLVYGAYLIASERTKIEPTIDSDDRLGVGRLGVKGNGGSSDCGAHLGYCLYDGFWHSRSDRLGELERFGGCEEEAEHRVGLCRVRMDDSQRRGTSFPFPSFGVLGTCNSRRTPATQGAATLSPSTFPWCAVATSCPAAPASLHRNMLFLTTNAIAFASPLGGSAAVAAQAVAKRANGIAAEFGPTSGNLDFGLVLFEPREHASMPHAHDACALSRSLLADHLFLFALRCHE